MSATSRSFAAPPRRSYYVDYSSEPPPEWVERPARAFNNLLQVPTLFYVVNLLMMLTGDLDRAQVDLAWTFVGLRVLHSTIYITINRVKYRFSAWMASCLVLGALWLRFAMSSVG